MSIAKYRNFKDNNIYTYIGTEITLTVLQISSCFIFIKPHEADVISFYTEDQLTAT